MLLALVDWKRRPSRLSWRGGKNGELLPVVSTVRRAFFSVFVLSTFYFTFCVTVYDWGTRNDYSSVFEQTHFRLGLGLRFTLLECVS